nr:YceD family protein [Microbacterium amylolyticum]
MREHELTIPAPERWGQGIVAVQKDREIRIDVRLESVHEGVLVSGTAYTDFEGECSRCLKAISQPVEVEFQELFEYPGQETSDYELQDDHVDLETLVREAIVLTLPFQPVCRPDCPGLDPATGELRSDESGVAQEPIDPRWAALHKLTETESASDAVKTREEK